MLACLLQYYMTKHLHSFGIDSDIAKFANKFCAEKRQFAKCKLLLQAHSFVNNLPEGLQGLGLVTECAELDPLGLLDEKGEGEESM